MARGRGGKTGGGGKSSGGSSGGGSSGGGSSGGGSSGGGSSGGRGRGGKTGGGGKPKYSPPPKPKYSPPPSPKRATTVNTSVSTQNTGRENPRSPTTNNPQVKTQNEIVRRPSIVTTNPPKIMTRPITLPSGKIWSDRPPTLPNADQNNSDTTNTPTFDGFTMNVGILPSIKKEFALHESDGNIITTNEIKTTFTPSEQQLRVLQAMEAQKKAEKDQSRANSEWQRKQDRLQASIQKMEAERQRTEDFRNRTDEEILQNFIRTQTTKELAGQFDNPEVPTNLNQYLAERGFDVTRPETIPTSVFKPTTLDTREKMVEAGLAPRIINMRLSIDNPNDTVTNKMTNTLIQPSQSVNWTGITETQTVLSRKVDQFKIDQWVDNYDMKAESTASPMPTATRFSWTSADQLFTPPNATNINKPIGRSTPLRPSVTTTGLSSPRTTLVTEAIETVVDPIPSNLSSLALLAGAFILT